MSNNIEIEGKILVTEDEFNKLLKHFNRTEEDKVMQTNHYIDSSEQILRRFGFALRIRERNGEYVLTLKTPLSEGLLEKNQNISKDVYKEFKYENTFPEGNIKDFLAMIGIEVKDLSILTSLKTERYDVKYQEGLLSLDKSTYNDIIDYEVELEETSLQHAHENLKTICEQVGIQYRLNELSKQARAMNSLKK